MTPEEMFRKLEYLPGGQIEEYELEGAVDTDLTLPAGHVIMTRFGHVEWGGIRRRTYVWEYGEEATEYYLCNPRSDTLQSHRFVARSSLRLISPEDAETTAEQPAVRATELEAQLAAQSAQGWRDFTEHPPIGEQIQITTVIDAVREEPDGLYRIGNTSEWQAWRPAPQEPTP